MAYTFIIDDFTIIASAIVFFVVIGTCFLNPFVRFHKRDTEDDDNADATNLPPLSIILTPHDEADKLERALPVILGQEYAAGFQVIVVIDEGAQETKDLLKRMQASLGSQQGDGSLYVTYIPDSSRYVSRKKLAITVGVKAAKTEWVIVTEAGSLPASGQWLKAMAANCDDATHLIIGYGNYSSSVSSFKRYSRLHEACYLMYEDVHGSAYRTLSHNLMFRKSDFMANDGFLGNLNLIRGEYDFLVNKYAPCGRTELVTLPAAWVTDEVPTQKTWHAEHVFYMETRRWLARGGWHRWWHYVDQAGLHIGLLLVLVAALVSLLSHNLTLLCVAGGTWLLSAIIRTIIGHRVVKSFDEDIPTLLLYPFEVSMLWHYIKYFVSYRLADKLDFTTHKQ